MLWIVVFAAVALLAVMESCLKVNMLDCNYKSKSCRIYGTTSAKFNSIVNVADNRLQSKRLVTVLIAVAALAMALISGLRYEMGGTDYFVYENVFLSMPKLNGFFKNFLSLDSVYLTYGHEKGWLFFMSAAKSIGIGYNGFLLCHSLFFFFCLFIFLKRYNPRPFLALAIFLYTLYFYNTMVSLRQSTTIAIFMLMLPLITQRKPIKYFLLVGICFTIHAAALILIFPYIFYKININKKFLKILLILSLPFLVLSLAGVNYLQPLEYFEGAIRKVFGGTFTGKLMSLINSSEPISILHTAQFLFILLLSFLFYDDLIKLGKPVKLAFTMLLCLYVILVIFRNYLILTRLKDYGYIFYGIILGAMCQIKNGKYETTVVGLTLAVSGVGYFRYINVFDNGHFWNYTTIFKK